MRFGEACLPVGGDLELHCALEVSIEILRASLSDALRMTNSCQCFVFDFLT
jgi:hypothetical protein